MALDPIVQDQFGGGIFRGRRAPADSVWDCVNGLLNDERQLYRRGGSAYKSTAGSSIWGALFDGFLTGGQRTVFWAPSGTQLSVLAADDVTPLTVDNSVGPYSSQARPVGVSGVLCIPSAVSGLQTFVEAYGGSRKTANYTTGSVTVTKDSAAVTGSGTLFSANVDAGMLLISGGKLGVVKSVNSNTSITLAYPWVGTTAAGAAYSLQRRQASVVFNFSTPLYVATAGRRLLACVNQQVYFSPRDDPLTFTVASDFHQLPGGAAIVGADAIGDTAVIFTTRGVWAIANLVLDELDEVGNIQHQVAQVNQDIVLWGDPGIANYQGALIVPGLDDVWAFSLDAPPVAISQGIRPLYREYVETSGYRPGFATVYRGHYFLPILDGSDNVVDALVCRLDLTDSSGARRPAWTRQANGAASPAYAVRVGATDRTPKLFGLDGLRISDLTGIFDPDSTRKADASGTNHQLTVDSNDFQTGSGGRANMVRSALVTAELVDAASDNPTYQFYTAAGQEGSAYTQAPDMSTGSGNMPETDGTTLTQILVVGPNGAGGRKVDRIRWRFRTTGAAASAVLRRVELRVRRSGRQ